MNSQEAMLISLVRAVLKSEEFVCTPEELFSCFSLAHEHGVSNLLYYAIERMPRVNRPDATQCGTLKRVAFAASAREALQQKNIEAVLNLFEQEKLFALPLKGALLKQLYPKPELRFMSDIDLLVDPKQAELIQACMHRLGFRTVKYNAGDTDIYVSPEGLNFELHRNLSNEGINNTTGRFLSELLDDASPKEDCTYIRRLSPEKHYAYVLCHIAKHLMNGGIGIRPIMDVWVYRHFMKFDSAAANGLLMQLELDRFAAAIEHLSEVWFGDAEPTDLDGELGTYIIRSGSFGTDERRVADRMLKKNMTSRSAYLVSRLLPNYETMCRYYPSLKKCPPLLPLFWVRRWFAAMFQRRRKLSTEIDAVSATDRRVLQQRINFYERCGLPMYRKE